MVVTLHVPHGTMSCPALGLRLEKHRQARRGAWPCLQPGPQLPLLRFSHREVETLFGIKLMLAFTLKAQAEQQGELKNSGDESPRSAGLCDLAGEAEDSQALPAPRHQEAHGGRWPRPLTPAVLRNAGPGHATTVTQGGLHSPDAGRNLAASRLVPHCHITEGESYQHSAFGQTRQFDTNTAIWGPRGKSLRSRRRVERTPLPTQNPGGGPSEEPRGRKVRRSRAKVSSAHHPRMGHVGRDEAVAVEGDVTDRVSGTRGETACLHSVSRETWEEQAPAVSETGVTALLVHPIIPHGDQAFLASADDFPVIHLDCRDSKLVGRQRQGDFVGAEVVDPHPGSPRRPRCERVSSSQLFNRNDFKGHGTSKAHSKAAAALASLYLQQEDASRSTSSDREAELTAPPHGCPLPRGLPPSCCNLGEEHLSLSEDNRTVTSDGQCPHTLT